MTEETYITCPCGQYLPIMDTAFYIICFNCNTRISQDELTEKHPLPIVARSD